MWSSEWRVFACRLLSMRKQVCKNHEECSWAREKAQYDALVSIMTEKN
jgi:hypothetical protein